MDAQVNQLLDLLSQGPITGATVVTAYRRIRDALGWSGIGQVIDTLAETRKENLVTTSHGVGVFTVSLPASVETTITVNTDPAQMPVLKLMADPPNYRPPKPTISPDPALVAVMLTFLIELGPRTDYSLAGLSDVDFARRAGIPTARARTQIRAMAAHELIGDTDFAGVRITWLRSPGAELYYASQALTTSATAA